MSAAQPTAKPEFQTIEARRAAIRGAVIAGAELTGPYLAMDMAAALIAGFGLIENSPAVIIGAMLIAMLFGPIIGVAMALAEADLRLLGRALKAELVGAICVLAISCLIGISTRHLTIGSEILNRTAPNLLDLLIALAGGIARGFTFLSTSLSGVIVGLAIATALVPPLTTCGILLARGLPQSAIGAFWLFLAELQPQVVVDYDSNVLLGAQIAFGRLNRRVTKQELDLLQIAAGFAAVGVPKNIQAQLAGESLFNDGIGAVLFLAVLAASKGQTLSVSHIGGLLLLESGGGLLLGIALAWIASELMRRVDA